MLILSKIHPDVRKYTLGAKRTATTVERLEKQLMSPPVVATTCLSTDQYVDIFSSVCLVLKISSPLFSRRVFDYCIVDEASQITLPTCLGPLRFADKFVLVGDHNQLPPLVRLFFGRFWKSIFSPIAHTPFRSKMPRHVKVALTSHSFDVSQMLILKLLWISDFSIE
jgi:superfamily I DNA and/or RNA helicase